MDSSRVYDVLILGGGNAALCAALTARAAGRSVLVVETAPKEWRGGNSAHTRNLRCMHDAPSDALTGIYTEREYWDDLVTVTGGQTDERLARLTIRSTATIRDWMKCQGARFQPSMSGTLHVSRTNAFFLGGGKALINAYYRTAENSGIEISYDSEVLDLNMTDGRFSSAIVRKHGSHYELRARAVVVACGGFESNIEWLKEVWGNAASNFLIRGTRFNRGDVLRSMINGKGAKSVGDPKQCHCVAIDARAPRYDGGIATRVDCVSLGIVVNKDGERFYDEGEDFWPKRYAIWGRLVAAQPDQIAYCIIDAKAIGKFVPPVFRPSKAQTIPDLARALKLDPSALDETVRAFNRSVRQGKFDHEILDNCTTEGIEPRKSHWAREIDTPPFSAYPLRPGITFTYLGVKVNERAKVIMQDDQPSHNIFAAGEIMAGNILGKGYIAGIGMAIGTAFGCIAGKEAAASVDD